MKLLISILCIFYCFTGSGQVASEKKKLYIIGTIHNGSKKISHKNLLSLLQEIDPDIILYEHNRPYQRVSGLLTGRFLKIFKLGIEQTALQKFTRRKRDCAVLPFDTLIPNRKTYLATQARQTTDIWKELAQKVRSRVISTEDSAARTAYTQAEYQYYNQIYDKDLHEINKAKIFGQAKFLYKMEEDIVLPIVRQYLSDSTLINDYSKEVLFWKNRNTYMASRIKTHAENNTAKKIVVLTGLNHKYFLEELLRNDSKLDLVAWEGHGQ